MIKLNDLKKQVLASQRLKSTTPILKEIILKITANTLTEFYGSNLSTMCLQSSRAINHILTQLHIKSVICGKDFAIIQTFTNKNGGVWNGFYDVDHHAWVHTEFCEIVDLTVKDMHRHHANLYSYDPIPPIWISVKEGLPTMMKYIPTSSLQNENIKFEEESDEAICQEMLSYLNLKTNSKNILDFDLMDSKMNAIESEISFKERLDSNDPWTVKSYHLSQMLSPPDWIQEMEQKLISKAKQR